MNILYDVKDLYSIQDRYTVLELDTFALPQGELTTAYALIEHVNLTDMFGLESWIDLHQKLLDNYKKQNWNFCLQALAHLQGRWDGELDSFYQHLNDRIMSMKDQELENWTPVMSRT
jgi:hypothetical protein